MYKKLIQDLVKLKCMNMLRLSIVTVVESSRWIISEVHHNFGIWTNSCIIWRIIISCIRWHECLTHGTYWVWLRSIQRILTVLVHHLRIKVKWIVVERCWSFLSCLHWLLCESVWNLVIRVRVLVVESINLPVVIRLNFVSKLS